MMPPPGKTMRLTPPAEGASPSFGRNLEGMRPRPSAAIAVLALCLVIPATGADAPPPDNPSGVTGSPYLHADLRELTEAITFHVSFDAESMVPDLAAGDAYRPQLHASWDKKHTAPVFADGLVGKALVLGTGLAYYPSAGNAPLDTRGAVALWVKPENWRRPNGATVGFFQAAGGGGAQLILQRQGPGRTEAGVVSRHEQVQCLARGSSAQQRFTNIPTQAWDNGGWHLMVVNWSWPRMEVSIDAGPFRARSAPSAPKAGAFRNLVVGSGGGFSDRTLLDELLIFRRPLSRQEAQLLHRILAKQAAVP